MFTYCKDRGKDKCPPWSLQATEMNHDKNKKTIFYDNAVIAEILASLEVILFIILSSCLGLR